MLGQSGRRLSSITIVCSSDVIAMLTALREMLATAAEAIPSACELIVAPIQLGSRNFVRRRGWPEFAASQKLLGVAVRLDDVSIKPRALVV